MAVNLSTNYAGLNLTNPIIAASSSLSSTPEGVRRLADAGVGAVVLKSLFEEQIQAEARYLEHVLQPGWHPEAVEYVGRLGMEMGPREYLKLVEEAKKIVSIPIIASLNCITPKWWVNYANQIEEAGADAIELNISMMPSDPNLSGQNIEQLFLKIFEEVKAIVDIPIMVKIGPYFTSIALMAKELDKRGVSALVLFNRFYQLDIDLEKLTIVPGHRFSSPDEMSLPLRWVALLSGRLKCDITASTGIHDGAGVIKQILAGATAVQICSTLYLKGLGHINNILEDINEWMKTHSFDSIDQIRGKLSQLQSDRPELYERLQYIKVLVGIE